MKKYTVRELMVKTDLTYNNTYSLIRKMRDKGLIQEVKKTSQVGTVTNAKRYGLLMDPNEFIRIEREQHQSPPPTFFNNPFNLRQAENLRLEEWKQN